LGINKILEMEIITESNWELIRSWLPKRSFTLLFKATIHGFKCSEFHSRCNDVGPTLVVCRTNHGRTIGGYSCLNWKSTSSEYEYSIDIGKSCFLFNLHDGQKYDMKGDSNMYAICNSPNHGPKFGGGHDLEIVNDCNTRENEYNRIGFTYQYDNLAGPSGFYGGDKYTVTDYEVYKVEYIYEDREDFD